MYRIGRFMILSWTFPVELNGVLRYAMNGLQQMVGGLLSYGVSHIHSTHIKSWQVLFMMVGQEHAGLD